MTGYDLEGLFREARGRLRAPAVMGPCLDPLRVLFPRAPMRAAVASIVGVLPGIPAGEGFWEPLPWVRRSRATLRLVVAVRAGDPEEGGPIPAIERHPITNLPTPAGERTRRFFSATQGPEILDILACDLAMSRPPRRLSGMAAALGVGADGEGTDAGAGAVILCRTVGEFFAALGQDASLPLGSAAERQRTIQGFAGGVIAQDLPHGEAIERLLARPIPPPPPIMVRASVGAG